MKITTALLLLLLAPTVAIPTAYPGYQSLDAPETQPSLREFDAAAKRQRVDASFHRTVDWVRGVRSEGSDSPDPSGQFAVVNYIREGPERELGSGLQVWIDRKSGTSLTVPNSMVMRAHLAVVRSGHDLTRYSWIVEATGDYFHFTFTPRLTGQDPADGGVFTVVLHARSGNQVGGIRYQP